MNPKYSILLCGQDFAKYKNQIKAWLLDGIKVFWFGKQNEVENLITSFPLFKKEMFLQAFYYDGTEKAVLIDGEASDIPDRLAEGNLAFNVAQYKVEHCLADRNIIVEASAGTGKTTVMIDRILYLMHMVEGLRMQDICMITFTNDATDQMNRKLQEKLLKKYKLTGKQRYLNWLEEQSQMNISTIHSFAYRLFRKFGVDSGFANDASLASFQYERLELIKDQLNMLVDEQSSVASQIGLSYYQGASTVRYFWMKMAQLGFSGSDISEMDWGHGRDLASENFQQSMLTAFSNLDQEYLKAKQGKNAIELDDILRDLALVLNHYRGNYPELNMRYLFVDEFQDSDNAQIRVLAWLARNLQTTLFVVGDIKQSIYRFRGATDTAFLTLKDHMKEAEIEPAEEFSLQNNYRTASNVLESLDTFFRTWAHMGYLVYDHAVIPCCKGNGLMKVLYSRGRYSLESEMLDIIREAMQSCKNRVESQEIKNDEKARVVVLTRSNLELIDVVKICQANHIPVTVKAKGHFFISEAVRDFYAMISSYVFPYEPKRLFEYILTPYAGSDDTIDMHDLEGANGDADILFAKLKPYLDRTRWETYDREFRLWPVMKIIKKILDNEPILENYISINKRRKTDAGWKEEACNLAVQLEAIQYQANLDKLMELLQRELGGKTTSLYEIYEFLQLMIATNREEEDAEVENNSDYRALTCMTVHKAKGLEFDTIIIPFTTSRFCRESDTEILVNGNNTQIGWKYTNKSNGQVFENSFYPQLKEEENQNAVEEETRILYVAMTRAIHSLYCIVGKTKEPKTWAGLISAGDTNG